MNNKLTRQQALDKVRGLLTQCVSVREACEVMEALTDNTRVEDPERFEGFSNRETWEAVQAITRILDPHEFRGLSPSELKEFAETRPACGSIGSLWRVNWGEVAEVLKGGEG